MIDLSCIGIDGFAFDRDEAINYIMEVGKEGKVVLGGDVFCVPPSGKIKHTYDNWYYNTNDDLTFEDNIEKSICVAVNFIENFKKNDTLYFSVVSCDRSALLLISNGR